MLGQPVALSPKAYALSLLLFTQPGTLLTRAYLEQA
nr:helix-turn-helix domain-containing protein [Cupriavidus taiwanensis]